MGGGSVKYKKKEEEKEKEVNTSYSRQKKNYQCQMIMCSKTYQCNKLQKQKFVHFTKYMCKFTNSHSANIKLSCSLCRVNTTKSKWKSIQHFTSFCFQTLHLNDKISGFKFVCQCMGSPWVAAIKIQVFNVK